MRSPDVERIEGLLRGLPPETEREAELERLIRELRTSLPPAPPELRERVRVLREPEPRRRQFGWRPVLVVVPLALAFAGAALLGGRGGGGTDEDSAGSAVEAPAAVQTTEAFRAQQDTARSSAPAAGGVDALADTARAQEWDVTLELRVRDNDRLSEASADAIRTTRSLGGHVVSSNVSTEGSSGRSDLVLRVPTSRIQDAIAQLSALGTITAQNVQVQDRQDDLDRLARRIDALRVQIAQLNLRLRTESLDEATRLRLELQRQRLTSQVNAATAQRRGVQREVAMAEVRLGIHTGRSAVAAPEGRIEGAAGDALHVLSLAGAAAVFLAIVLSPLLALGVLAFFLRRAHRRRTEERLLEQPRPASR
jgi:hypothetical protein